MSRLLACPACKSTNLATIERLTGSCDMTIEVDGEAQHDGRTDINWDSSTTIGVMCKECYWTCEGEYWRNQLVPEPEECDQCGEEIEERDGVLVHTETLEAQCTQPPVTFATRKAE